MVQVSYPGVYIEEIPSGVNTITGVSTSITAFFGRSAKGPMDKAVRCLSYSDFLRSFGGAHAASELAISVKQFFDNGGTDCYVVRLAGAGKAKAGIDVENWGGTPILRATAKMEGVWGNGLRLVVDYNTPNPGESFNLQVIQEEGGRQVASETHANLTMDAASARFAPTFVTQSSALIDLDLVPAVDPDTSTVDGFSEARRPLGTDFTGVQTTLSGLIGFGNPTGQRLFEISVNGSAYVTVDLTSWDVDDASVTTIANIETQLADRINNGALSALVPAQTVGVAISPSVEAGGEHFLRLTATSGDTSSVKIRRAPTQDLAGALMLGVDNGGVEIARRSDFRPAPTGSVLRFEDGAGALTRLNTLGGLQQSDLDSIQVDGEPAILLNVAPNNLQTTAAGDPMYQDASGASSPNGNNDGVREKLQIIANAISNAPGSRYRAEVHGYQLVVLAKDGTFNQIPSAITFAGAQAGQVNPAMQLNNRQYTLGPNGTSAFVTFNAGTQTGNDGGAPGFNDYVGNPLTKTGFHALDPVDLFNLMVLPPDTGVDETTHRQLWGPASIYCQSRRAFLIVDSPASWTDSQGNPAVVQNTADVNNLRATVVKDYSAVFYPKLRINDGGLIRTIGASGAIAGLMARTDANRGVWKAPAGTEADLRGILGFNVRLTDGENGVLNKLGVNCMRGFPSGYVNWGARTLDGSDDIGSEWKYVPIRRLALFIEESLYRGTQWVVFEPNDEPLWANIRLNIGVFMNGLFRQGAFQGSTPKEAFFVKCDATTTTQADRNLGIVNIVVGFAPLKPAEFVVITIQQIAGDLS